MRKAGNRLKASMGSALLFGSALGVWPALYASPGESTNQQAEIIVNSSPTGADVLLSGSDMGPTPLLARVPAGPHALRVDLDGYQPLQEEHNVEAGEVRTITVELEPTGAKRLVALTGPAEFSGARVYLEGKLLGSLPAKVELPAGQHTFQIVGRDFFSKVTREVPAQAGATVLELDLRARY